MRAVVWRSGKPPHLTIKRNLLSAACSINKNQGQECSRAVGMAQTRAETTQCAWVPARRHFDLLFSVWCLSHSPSACLMLVSSAR